MAEPARPRILQVSNGFSYAWDDPLRPARGLSPTA